MPTGARRNAVSVLRPRAGERSRRHLFQWRLHTPRPMLRADIDDRGRGVDTDITCKGAARGEAAARRYLAHVGERAFDRRKSCHSAIEPRNRGEEPNRVRVLWSAKQYIDWRVLNDFA